MKKHLKLAAIALLLASATSADKFQLDQNGNYKSELLPRNGSKLNKKSVEIFKKYTKIDYSKHSTILEMIREDQVKNNISYCENSFGKFMGSVSNPLENTKPKTFFDFAGTFVSDVQKHGIVRILSEKDYRAGDKKDTTLGYEIGLKALDVTRSIINTGISAVVSVIKLGNAIAEDSQSKSGFFGSVASAAKSASKSVTSAFKFW